MEPGTSFRQFEYCTLCKVNHKKRKKHIYSKHHQEILRNILNKFEKKISSAKKTLFSPEVKDADYEIGAKFWCYFCANEVGKHKVVEMTTVLVAGLLEHIASFGHKENTVQFFWDNLLTDKKLKASFLLPDGDWEIRALKPTPETQQKMKRKEIVCPDIENTSFKKASFLAVKRFQKAKDIERKKVASTISYSEFQRQNFVQSEAQKVGAAA